MRRNILLTLFILLAVIISSGCSLRNDVLNIGIVPSESPEKLRLEFQMIEQYLEKEMKRDVSVYVPGDYKELIRAMKDGSVDLGLFGPFSYIIADSQQKLLPVLVRKKKGFGITYNSILIASADSDFFSIEDLEGGKIAFVNSASTSGYIIPQSLFISRNIDQKTFFLETYFSGSHDLSIEDVINGNADCAAVSKTILKRLIADELLDESQIRIIWESDPIPGSPYIARGNLDKKTIDSFTEAMLDLHIDAPEALDAFDKTIEKYVPVEPGLYNSIRNIVNILGNDFIERNYL